MPSSIIFLSDQYPTGTFESAKIILASAEIISKSKKLLSNF